MSATEPVVPGAAQDADASNAAAAAAPPQPVTFYRRPLKPNMIAFQSDEGRAIFRRAVQTEYMETYYSLAANFVTQQEPSYCGLACLAMVLNTLEVDPGRKWKGVWRWYSEEMLDCCAPLERVIQEGITFDEFVCLAECNGLLVEAFAADTTTEDVLHSKLLSACSSRDTVLVASYDRSSLGQTGSGHFSPIGGFDPASSRVLLLDVARFKYPPHWVTVGELFSAMQPLDSVTGRPRGFILLRRNTDAPAHASALRPTLDAVAFQAAADALAATALPQDASPLDIVGAFVSHFSGVPPIEWRSLDVGATADALALKAARDVTLTKELAARPLARVVAQCLGGETPQNGEAVALFTAALLAGAKHLRLPGSAALERLDRAVAAEVMGDALAVEIAQLRRQAATLAAFNKQCIGGCCKMGC